MGLCKNFKIMETKPKVQNPNGPSPTLLDLSKNFKNIVSEPNPNPNPNPNPILKQGVKIHQKVAKGVRAHETGLAQIQSHLLLGLSKNFKNIVTEPKLNPNPKPEPGQPKSKWKNSKAQVTIPEGIWKGVAVWMSRKTVKTCFLSVKQENMWAWEWHFGIWEWVNRNVGGLVLWTLNFEFNFTIINSYSNYDFFPKIATMSLHFYQMKIFHLAISEFHGVEGVKGIYVAFPVWFLAFNSFFLFFISSLLTYKKFIE